MWSINHYSQESLKTLSIYSLISTKLNQAKQPFYVNNTYHYSYAHSRFLILWFVQQKTGTWLECIKKVWEVNPLECPKYGREMKIISFIDERLLIRHILKHLNLWQERIPKGLPLPEDTIVETIVCEEIDDGWGSYEDLDVTLH